MLTNKRSKLYQKSRRHSSRPAYCHVSWDTRYDITRHLLYKHFYDYDGLIALLNICSMNKHVICSINIFLQFYILQFFLQFHFSANFLEILFYYYEGFNHGRTILPSIFKTSPVLIDTLFV